MIIRKQIWFAFVSKRLPFFNREDVTIVTTGTTGKHVKHAGIKKRNECTIRSIRRRCTNSSNGYRR